MTNAVVFMDIVNGGQQTDRLLGAACNCAARVELHEMSMAGGIMRMRPAAAGLEIPPAGAVRLAPQGPHLMLMGLKQPLHPGQPVPLTLQFATRRQGDRGSPGQGAAGARRDAIKNPSPLRGKV